MMGLWDNSKVTREQHMRDYKQCHDWNKGFLIEFPSVITLYQFKMEKHYIESNTAPITNAEKREIGDEAVWTLSSAKAGNGVEQLRDENTNSFWQSDGAQPHFVNIQFMKKTRIQEIAIYLDSRADESYTPNKISIRAGNNLQDLKQIQFLDLKDPVGWYMVPLKAKLLNNANQKDYILTMNIQICILQNQHSGKDTHIRMIKIFGPKEKLNQGEGFPNFKSPDFTQYFSIR